MWHREEVAESGALLCLVLCMGVARDDSCGNKHAGEIGKKFGGGCFVYLSKYFARILNYNKYQKCK